MTPGALSLKRSTGHTSGNGRTIGAQERARSRLSSRPFRHTVLFRCGKGALAAGFCPITEISVDTGISRCSALEKGH